MLEEDKLASAAGDIEQIAAQKPWGAVTLCLIATLIVVGAWFAFYFLAFLPRGLLR